MRVTTVIQIYLAVYSSSSDYHHLCAVSGTPVGLVTKYVLFVLCWRTASRKLSPRALTLPLFSVRATFALLFPRHRFDTSIILIFSLYVNTFFEIPNITCQRVRCQGTYSKGRFSKSHKICYLPIGKGREIAKISRHLFLTKR